MCSELRPAAAPPIVLRLATVEDNGLEWLRFAASNLCHSLQAGKGNSTEGIPYPWTMRTCEATGSLSGEDRTRMYVHTCMY